MCNAKPGTRCVTDQEKKLDVSKRHYRDALTAHAENLDDESTTDRVKDASQKLWNESLELAGAQAGKFLREDDPKTKKKNVRPVTDDWRTNVGFELYQAHQDQAALMPPNPGKDAPKPVRDAYLRLAEARDRLARADAVTAADEQVALSSKPQPAPAWGSRPSQWTTENDVADAEYAYAQALHPSTDTQEGEQWRHLVNKGQMPYDPFSNAMHPAPGKVAPWAKHNRAATAIDVPALRRASGLREEVYWDADERKIVVEPDMGGYLDTDEREDYADRIEQSMWQLGYMTERDGARITASRAPDIAGWIAAASRRTTTRTTKAA